MTILRKSGHFWGMVFRFIQTQLKEGLQTEYHFAPAHKNRQSAAAVGALAMQYLKEGKTETANGDTSRINLRLSQAEGAGRKKCKGFRKYEKAGCKRRLHYWKH